MKLTNTQKALLPKETQELIEAGFLTPDLKITSDLAYFLEHLALMQNMKEVVKRAVEKNKENEQECKTIKVRGKGIEVADE